MKFLIIILSSWLLTGCIIFPGPVGIVGEYGAVTVQPNPIVVEPSYNTYYTTPYNTGNTVYYAPQVVVPPPKTYYGLPRYYYNAPRPYHHKPPYYGPRPEPYYNKPYYNKPYYGPRPKPNYH